MQLPSAWNAPRGHQRLGAGPGDLESDGSEAGFAIKPLVTNEESGIDYFLLAPGARSTPVPRRRPGRVARFTCHSRPPRHFGDGVDRPIEHSRAHP